MVPEIAHTNSCQSAWQIFLYNSEDGRGRTVQQSREKESEEEGNYTPVKSEVKGQLLTQDANILLLLSNTESGGEGKSEGEMHFVTFISNSFTMSLFFKEDSLVCAQ